MLFTICGGISIDSFQFTSSRAISLTVQIAMILSYLCSIFIAVHGMGINEIINYAKNPYLWQNINLQKHGINYLERHDLGAAVGLVIVYQLFFNAEKRIIYK